MSNEIEKTQVQGGALAISAQEVDDMFGNSALDTQGLSFQTVKISRETAQFMIGEAEVVKTMTGHILHKHYANQWWEIPFDQREEGSNPMPNCYSVDGIKPCGGDKTQSDFCSSCRKNKFNEAADGSVAKDCRNTIRLLFLQDGAVLPVMISLPPSSIGKKKSFAVWQNSVPNRVAAAYDTMGIKNKQGSSIVDYWPVRVKLSLQKEKFSGGMEASVLQIETLEVVIPDTKENANRLRTLFSMVTEAKKAYQQEIQAYMSSNHEEVDIAPAGCVEGAEPDLDDQSDIPI